MDGWIGVATGAALGLLFVALGWPLWRGKVPPNGWYGYRLPSTLGDARVWYPVNARGGRHLVGIGAVAIVLAAVGLFWIGDDVRQRRLLWVVLAWTMVALLVSAVVCFLQARRLAKPPAS